MLDLTHAPSPKVIEGVTGPWELVIGLEVHAQVATAAKLFSGASTEVGAEPNSHVSFVDAGMPAEQMPQVRAALDRLGPLARRIVQSDLDEALRNVAEQFLEAEARRLSS